MRRSISIALSMLLASGTAAAESFSCPWYKLSSGKRIAARSISVFDGPPAEMAELVPDNADIDPKAPYYWTFSGQESTIWVVCHYRRARQTRQFALPKAFKRCQAIGPVNSGSGLSCE